MRQQSDRAEYLADGELGVIGLPHGVVDEGGHQLSDLVQVTGPGFLRDERTAEESDVLSDILFLPR